MQEIWPIKTTGWEGGIQPSPTLHVHRISYHLAMQIMNYHHHHNSAVMEFKAHMHSGLNYTFTTKANYRNKVS
jgi:hypothetical protein